MSVAISTTTQCCKDGKDCFSQPISERQDFNRLELNNNLAIAIIDPSVENYHQLLSGLHPNIIPYVLSSNQDGICQITQIINNCRLSIDISRLSVHIIAHGAPGTLCLGNAELSIATLERYTKDLQAWFYSESRIQNLESELLIYGCSVAAGDLGEEFITDLHHLTGANIAASSSPVGHATLEGNWTFDCVLGKCHSAVAINHEVQQTYHHILDSEVGTLDHRHFIPPFFTHNSLKNNQAIKTHYLLLANPDTVDVDVTIKNAAGLNEVVRIPANGSLKLNLGGTNPGVGPNGEAVTFSGPAPNGETKQASLGLIGNSEMNQVNITDGLILEGTDRFYANVRHFSNDQGMSLTSKGQTALGKRFRTGHLLSNGQKADQKSNFFSVMAVEDGTTVRFSDLPLGLTYIGGTPPASITLNAGESYAIGVTAADNLTSDEVTFDSANDGINLLNGTLITSDEPIVVNSGSWLGGASDVGRDIGVDQIIPARFLGKEFIVAQGTGGNNETPLIVADTDNTEVFVNGGTTPIATINAGDYYYIDPALYANHAMYIQTSQSVYLYQNTDANARAGQGLNFVPPLNNTLELQDIVIPDISLLGTSSVNIVARVGATLTVTQHGAAVSLPSAQSVSGTSDWEIYFLTGLTGDVKVVSDQSVYTSLTTVSGFRGAAGFFSGFPNSYAVNDTVSTVVNVPIDIHFRVNDVNGIFDFAIDSFTTPLNGSIFLNDNGTLGDSTDDFFEYTPHSGFTGVDSFIYVVRESVTGIVIDSASITVTVTGDDNGNGNLPIAVDDTFTAAVGTPVTFNPLDNDSDSDGNLELTSVQLIDPATNTPTKTVIVPGEGAWSVDITTGEITFTPDAGFTNDPTPITYTVDDNDGNTSTPATITVDYQTDEGTGNGESDGTNDSGEIGTPPNTDSPEGRGSSGSDIVIGTNGDDILNGFSDVDLLIGGSGDDILNGGSSRDTLQGGSGNDILNGGSNNDEMNGGSGNDILNGGSGNDVIHGCKGHDIVNGGKGKDILFGSKGNDLLNGSGSRDRLFGERGRDIIRGGSGNDLIIGGFGKDELTGGQGRDRFVYESVKDFGDTITDFEIIKDKIDLRKIKSILGMNDLTLFQKGHQSIVQARIGKHLKTVMKLDHVDMINLNQDHFQLNSQVANVEG